MTEPDRSIILSSVKRMETISKYSPVERRQDIIDILSDQTDDEFRVYQEISRDDRIKTIATGVYCILKAAEHLKALSYSLQLFLFLFPAIFYLPVNDALRWQMIVLTWITCMKYKIHSVVIGSHR